MSERDVSMIFYMIQIVSDAQYHTYSDRSNWYDCLPQKSPIKKVTVGSSWNYVTDVLTTDDRKSWIWLGHFRRVPSYKSTSSSNKQRWAVDTRIKLLWVGRYRVFDERFSSARSNRVHMFQFRAKVLRDDPQFGSLVSNLVVRLYVISYDSKKKTTSNVISPR